ncbi:MAG TPA: hypothetical protein VEW48_22580 [Thermoanaerobaculia bacterium]|nr:hypothetical protein [Thermoanaerobaculia bacterium]
MPNLILCLLPLLSLLGLFAGPLGWLDDRGPRPDEGRTVAVAANGMAIDPDGGNGPGGAPVTIGDPTDPDH